MTDAGGYYWVITWLDLFICIIVLLCISSSKILIISIISNRRCQNYMFSSVSMHFLWQENMTLSQIKSLGLELIDSRFNQRLSIVIRQVLSYRSHVYKSSIIISVEALRHNSSRYNHIINTSGLLASQFTSTASNQEMMLWRRGNLTRCLKCLITS